MDVTDSAVFLTEFYDITYLIDIQTGNRGKVLGLDGVDVEGIGGELGKVIIGFLKGDSGTFAILKQILQIALPRRTAMRRTVLRRYRYCKE